MVPVFVCDMLGEDSATVIDEELCAGASHPLALGVGEQLVSVHAPVEHVLLLLHNFFQLVHEQF
jgi:hypothetical protein